MISASSIFGTQTCTRLVVGILLAYFLISLALFAATLPDALKFIQTTRGQHCWVYGSAALYSSYQAGESALLALAIYLARKLDARAGCWPVIVTGVAIFTAIILLRLFNGCG